MWRVGPSTGPGLFFIGGGGRQIGGVDDGHRPSASREKR